MGKIRKFSPRKERNPIPLGTRFGRLVTISTSTPTSSEYWYRHYECLCDCGNVTSPRKCSLLRGDTTSCGCYAKESAGDRVRTHGVSKHPVAGSYYGMVNRCTNEDSQDYSYYGGRGIKVCKEWLCKEKGLLQFIQDMGGTHVKGLEIERIDNNGNYEPSNCKWATRREQVLNRRFETVQIGVPNYLTFNGKTLCLSQWEDETGLMRVLSLTGLESLGGRLRGL